MVCTGAFRSQFDALVWDGSIAWLEARQAGRTGYPLVDAAMRQLAASGTMHNRLRMVARHFWSRTWGSTGGPESAGSADTLIDYDLAANNGGWQWVAFHRLRCTTWFRLFKPGDAVAEVRSGRAVPSAATFLSWRQCRALDSCAVAHAGGGAAAVRGEDRPRLSGADRRSRCRLRPTLALRGSGRRI